MQYVASQEGVTADINGLNIVAQKSEGGMRDALSIFDQLVSFCGNNITYQGVIENLNVLDYEYYFRLVDGFLKGDVQQSLLIFNDILNNGFDGHHFITGLSSHLRDVLVSKDPSTISLLEVGADIGERYKVQAQLCTPEFLFQGLKISNDCDIDYRLSKNKRLLVELALIRLCQLTDEKKKSLLIENVPPPIQKIAFVAPATTENTEITNTPSIAKVKQTEQPAAIKKENPVDSKPVFKRPGSISISTSGTVATPQANYNEEKVVEKIVQHTPFTIDDLEKAWQQFGKTIPEQGRITSFILNTRPVLISDTTFELTVSNILQEKELIRLQPDIVNFIQLKLHNSGIKMTLKIAAESEVQRANTPEDRYRIMADQNPALDKLKNALGLEID